MLCRTELLPGVLNGNNLHCYNHRRKAQTWPSVTVGVTVGISPDRPEGPAVRNGRHVPRLVRLLINLLQEGGPWGPPSGRRYVHVREVLPFRGPLPPEGVPPTPVNVFQFGQFLAVDPPHLGLPFPHGLPGVLRGREQIRGPCLPPEASPVDGPAGFLAQGGQVGLPLLVRGLRPEDGAN